MVMETKDLILGKAKYEDWRWVYRNVWSRQETAKYMLWKVTVSEEEAQERMKRTILWQETHDAWLVYGKGSGQAIGFAGVGKYGPASMRIPALPLGRSMSGKDMGNSF